MAAYTNNELLTACNAALDKCAPLSDTDLSEIARALKYRLQAEAQAPAPVLTEEERETVQRAKNRWNPESEVGELYSIIDRLTTPQAPSHPELQCQSCGGPNVTWFAPNDLWNKVVGSPDGILCPICFVQKAEAAGVTPSAWTISDEAQAPSVPTRETLRDAFDEWFRELPESVWVEKLGNVKQHHINKLIAKFLAPFTPSPSPEQRGETP